MLRTLVWKELRELMPLTVLALLVQAVVLLDATQAPTSLASSNRTIPFLGDAQQNFFYIAGAAAIAAGLWQTWWESGRGTFQFLLHRPVPRSSVFAVKLAVGVGLCLFITGLPILLYAAWAAMPGTHASPFFWSMTVVAWLTWLRLPLVYLGAFLSGLRPARWFGSRAFPLAAGVLAVIATSALENWTFIALPVSLALLGCFLLVIFHVAAARDYS